MHNFGGGWGVGEGHMDLVGFGRPDFFFPGKYVTDFADGSYARFMRLHEVLCIFRCGCPGLGRVKSC